MVNATQTENRTAYACRPTNENSLAAFLVDRNDYHFFNRDFLEKNEKPSQLFHSRCNRCDEFILVDYLPRGMLLMKKRMKIKIIARGRVGEAFCNRPKPKLLLQKNE